MRRRVERVVVIRDASEGRSTNASTPRINTTIMEDAALLFQRDAAKGKHTLKGASNRVLDLGAL